MNIDNPWTLEEIIGYVDKTLAAAGLHTYTQRCDQLCNLAEVAIRDTSRLQAEIVRLEAQTLKLIGARGSRVHASRAAQRKLFNKKP